MAFRKAKPYYDDLTRPIPGADLPYVLSLVIDDTGRCASAYALRRDKPPTAENTLLPSETNTFTLSLFGTERTVSMEWLIFFTFCPLYESQGFAHLLEVQVINKSDPIDYHPRNLTWVIPEGGVDDPDKPGFKIVPFYSGTSVSAQGEVWSRRKKRFCTLRVASNGKGNTYHNTSCTLNSGTIDTIGQHRLVAMAFLRLEGNPFTMTVNHKDGVKSINLQDNLEWATYTQNNLHAKDTGLQKVRNVMYVRDYKDNMIVRFKSLSHAALYLGVNPGTVCTFMQREAVFLDRYEFIDEMDLADGTRSWNEKYFKDKGWNIERPREMGGDDLERPIAVYHVDSNEAVVFKNQYDVATHLNIPTREVLSRLLRANKIVKDGTVVCFRDELKAVSEWVKSGDKLKKRVRDFLMDGTTRIQVEIHKHENDQDPLVLVQVVSNVRALLHSMIAASHVPSAFEKLRWQGEVKVGNKFFKVIEETDTDPQPVTAVE